MIERQLMVAEVKGLLKSLEVLSRDARFQLASDNLRKITNETAKIRVIIDRIDNKVDSLEEDCFDEFM